MLGTQLNVCWPYLNDNLFFLKAEEPEPEAEEEIEGDETMIPEGSEALEVAEETGGSLPEESEVSLVPESG